MTRKEIVELWIKNGAMMGNTSVDGLYQDMTYSDREFDLGYAGGGSSYRTHIYEILYSPRSNFFDVMFGTNLITLAGIGQVQMKNSDYHKRKCVTSKDPLKYIVKS